MKTTNYLKAFGTINLSLIIIGLILLYYFPITRSLDGLSEVSKLVHYEIVFLYSFGSLLGLINGMLSFLVNFDFKKG